MIRASTMAVAFLAYGSANAAELGITFGEVEAIVRDPAKDTAIEVRERPGKLYFLVGSRASRIIITAHRAGARVGDRTTRADSTLVLLWGALCFPDADFCDETDQEKEAVVAKYESIVAAISQRVVKDGNIQEGLPFPASEACRHRSSSRKSGREIWKHLGCEFRPWIILYGFCGLPYPELLKQKRVDDKTYEWLANDGRCPSPWASTW
jgi:hypothetical protein